MSITREDIKLQVMGKMGDRHYHNINDKLLSGSSFTVNREELSIYIYLKEKCEFPKVYPDL
jgi:hypothetical protein